MFVHPMRQYAGATQGPVSSAGKVQYAAYGERFPVSFGGFEFFFIGVLLLVYLRYLAAAFTIKSMTTDCSFALAQHICLPSNCLLHGPSMHSTQVFTS